VFVAAQEHEREYHGLLDIAALAGFLYLYTLLVAVLFGGPLFLLLRRASLIRWWTAGIVGLLIGAGVAALFYRSETPVQLLFAATGAVAGLVFWAVWRTGSDEDVGRVPSA
jgi:hypothetical protein